MLFGTNLDLLPGEAISAQAEDQQLAIYPVAIEYLAPLPGVASVMQLIIKLPSNLPAGQQILISVTLHSQTSNKVRIQLR
jgi:uncharacterized protein (TIGR03437 family)